jgi:hypothetical protein
MSAATLRALDHYLPNGSVVASAEALAAAVLAEWKMSGMARVSFEGLRGVSSAYFNTLLLVLCPTVGVTQLTSTIEFVTDSKAQRDIFDRSLQAVLKSVSGSDSDQAS